jgi:hypothetical protein
MDISLTMDTIEALRRQEESGYCRVDYLQAFQDQPERLGSIGPLHADEDCRSKMVSWCYQVTDFCKFQRETVEIAMSILDRYLMTPAGLSALADRKVYQLAAMTCLYTAVKIHEPEAMDPNLVSNLSRGTYMPEEVEKMEAKILMAVQWRVNPPTALAFVRKFLELIPNNVLDEGMRATAYDITKYQTELAVNEYDFIPVKASTVAFCSIINSLESIGLDSHILKQISNCLSQAVGLDFADYVLGIQNYLYEAVIRQPVGFFTLEHSSSAEKPSSVSRRSSIDVSPRSSMR